MRTKAKYKKDQVKVEKMVQEKIEHDPVAKKQDKFYKDLFKKSDNRDINENTKEKQNDNKNLEVDNVVKELNVKEKLVVEDPIRKKNDTKNAGGFLLYF